MFNVSFDDAEFKWEFLDIDQVGGVKLHSGEFDERYNVDVNCRGRAIRDRDHFTSYDNASLSRDDIKNMVENEVGIGDDHEAEAFMFDCLSDDDAEEEEEEAIAAEERKVD